MFLRVQRLRAPALQVYLIPCPSGREERNTLKAAEFTACSIQSRHIKSLKDNDSQRKQKGTLSRHVDLRYQQIVRNLYQPHIVNMCHFILYNIQDTLLSFQSCHCRISPSHFVRTSTTLLCIQQNTVVSTPRSPLSLHISQQSQQNASASQAKYSSGPMLI